MTKGGGICICLLSICSGIIYLYLVCSPINIKIFQHDADPAILYPCSIFLAILLSFITQDLIQPIS